MNAIAAASAGSRTMRAPEGAPQRIVAIRRDYNRWVADETLEDYALRFTPQSFRKWSEFRVANTAIGAVSFLALEAIGGAIALNYGFVNAFWAIVVVSTLIFLTGLPISYYAAKHGVDIDLLTRGAGFGYMGSTVTSLIYASFTFIFFALEAVIMALAIELWTGLPLAIGYVVCSVVVIPLVTHGITLISRLQSWTQPLWIVLLVLPYACILVQEPEAVRALTTFSGHADNGLELDLLLFGAAATVTFSLMAQIGEQVDFLRFLPKKTAANRVRWWLALLAAGPGWILPGMAKLLGGALLVFLVLQNEIDTERAVEPTQMYLVAFRYVFDDPRLVLGAVTLFVIVSQLKINVTNAYAGSLAWSNFFSRVTHSHPGRVVWVVFNVGIALVLMELGVFHALNEVLGVYSHIAISWLGVIVADLVVNKPLGLSPPGIEFKRAYLHDINPVGVGSMTFAVIVSITAHAGVFGAYPQALSSFIALAVAFVSAPLIAWATRSQFYLARPRLAVASGAAPRRCVICENAFEVEDMAHCPAYGGSICSLCCTLDARCNDRCKPDARLPDRLAQALRRLLPFGTSQALRARLSKYAVLLGATASILGAVLGIFYLQETAAFADVAPELARALQTLLFKLFWILLIVAGVGAWWLVLSNETRQVATAETERQTQLLLNEIAAHKRTDAELQRAKESADAANVAKSRFMAGMSHELRSPLNSMLGYAQVLERDPAMPERRREALGVIRRSGDHLLTLIDGLLDIAQIEAGKLKLEIEEVRFPELLEQMVQMFEPQAARKGLRFAFEVQGPLPQVVRTDGKRLRQVLINLLGNAVKFTDAGQVTLVVRHAMDMVRIEIVDTGIGIAPDELKRVFLPFERSHAALKRGEIGTGLGLTICRMLTDVMGGELTVRSELAVGSVFSLRLYLPKVWAPVALPPERREVHGYDGRRRRILVVDDQASQRQVLLDMLAPLGFDLAQADSGEACLEQLRDGVPDAVLLDVGMAGMDGWETCRRIRAEGLRALPVIIVSATGPSGDASTGEPCHTDFVIKPVSMPELLAKLGNYLDLRWRVVETAAAAARPLDTLPRYRPARAELSTLLELGAIGYVKGIVAKLDAIERDEPRARELTSRLRHLIVEYRFAEYASLVRQCMEP